MPGGPSLLLMVVLIGVLSIAGLVVVRRAGRWVRSWSGAEPGPAFTLHELRQMHRRGQISDQEFDALRGALLRAAPGGTAASADAGAAAGGT